MSKYRPLCGGWLSTWCMATLSSRIWVLAAASWANTPARCFSCSVKRATCFSSSRTLALILWSRCAARRARLMLVAGFGVLGVFFGGEVGLAAGAGLAGAGLGAGGADLAGLAGLESAARCRLAFRRA